ncbi:WD repeat-containing protein [Xylaria bambusicola]|uniref:WD repeat-containing protein n=1 Tax=Xylaria bambusicola TaxID=326684 RepID=UPI002008D78C|nr:WD repeat-containing protein [Xylaria bambusicola]KAI0508692.1 WD repeat-containing protein [Xylaria bambusicola]
MSQQPAAQPKSVLRGHRTQVHATTFVRNNKRLASGDADGFVVLWDLTIMRPRAVWRAHTAAILGISGWGDDKLVTEGRDNRLIVWKITTADEENLSTDLPLDESAPERPQPWILHILEVNTMNFCSFAQCSPKPGTDLAVSDELLLAVPNTLATEAVDIFHLPSQTRLSTVHLGSKTEKKGMVMALSLFWRHEFLFLLAGYENGLAVVARRRHKGAWDILYKYQAHSQPILSLDCDPEKEYFLTSGADAIIAKHPIPHANPATPLVPVSEKVVTPSDDSKGVEESKQQLSGLSAGLAAMSTPDTASLPRGLPKKKAVNIETSPLKVINTKHSGQQGLQVRSDGRIFATAGWDSKVRVYSAKTMTELAVLKWHNVGCYAAAFSTLEASKSESGSDDPNDNHTKAEVQEPARSSEDTIAVENEERSVTTGIGLGELSVKDRRIKMAKEAHWLAAGSKDGKISLWDIY